MPSPPEYKLIQTEGDLADLVRLTREASRVAVDTEADSLHHYFEKVCLIQLTMGDLNFIVDPLVGLDLSEFFDALSKRPLVLHGADYDLRMLMSTYGFRPRAPVLDTMLAALLLGDSRPGLASLVERHFDWRMSKKAQKADWARRPLTERMLTYAVDDTRFLFSLCDRLRAELDGLGRNAWHDEWCQKQVDSTGQQRTKDPDQVWRLKGAGRLSRQQLGFLREIWQWRDLEAQKIDRPPFHVLGNQQLLNLAIWAAKDPSRNPRRFPQLGRRCSGERLQALRQAIAQASKLARAAWPEKRKGRRRNDSGHGVKPLRAAAAELAADLGLDPAVLAPRAAVEAIARAQPADEQELHEASGLMRWQSGTLAQVFLGIISGP